MFEKLPRTLTQFLVNELADQPKSRDILLMMSDMATIGKLISSQTNRTGLVGLKGKAGGNNVHDEEQAKLDVIANNLCKSYLGQTGHFVAMASEEEEESVDLSQQNPDGKYIIAFDPLDGSSNIDVNVSIGTIFSIHEKRTDVPVSSPDQFNQTGKDQVLAGYVLYGSSTVLVFTYGNGVHEFTLDQDIGEFLLSDPAMQIPDAVPFYSMNEAYIPLMKPADQQYVAQIKEQYNPKIRWIGSMVADVHRTLIKGGVFILTNMDNEGAWKPKLRLMYEAKPMAFIVEQAGGSAFAEAERVLDILPSELHQRVPVVLGSKTATDNYTTTQK